MEIKPHIYEWDCTGNDHSPDCWCTQERLRAYVSSQQEGSATKDGGHPPPTPVRNHAGAKGRTKWLRRSRRVRPQAR